MPGDPFAPYRVPLEDALKAALPADGSPVAAACRYVMGWEDESGSPSNAGGKRLRPLVAIHIGISLGAPIERALPGAVAIELVHNFSLVHDEIQDQDDMRHGRPTLWARLGTAQAINAGDLLFTRAFAHLGGQGDPEQTVICSRTFVSLARATEQMIRGQWMDLSFEERETIEPAEYLEMIALKTGALIGACGAAGAIAAGQSDHVVEAFERWGVSLGLAFQAQDDFLGTWGDVEMTGKSNTNDIARRKKSLPILLGMANEVSREAVREAYAGSPGSSDDVARVTAALEEAGIRDETAAMAVRFREEAEELLQALPEAAGREELLAMGRLLVERDA